MEYWTDTCPLTGLPILYGDEVAAILITENNPGMDMDGNEAAACPVTLPVYGKYNSRLLYDPEENMAFRTAIANTELFIETSDGIERFDTSGMTDDDLWETLLQDLFEYADIGQLLVYNASRKNGYAPVSAIYLHKDAAKLAINGLKTAVKFRPDLATALQEANMIHKLDKNSLTELCCIIAVIAIANASGIRLCNTNDISDEADALDNTFWAQFYLAVAQKATAISQRIAANR